MATASMPCSPPPALTSLFSCAGWRGFCAPCSRRSPQHRRRFAWPKNRRSAVLHGRLCEALCRLDHDALDAGLFDRGPIDISLMVRHVDRDVAGRGRRKRHGFLPARVERYLSCETIVARAPTGGCIELHTFRNSAEFSAGTDSYPKKVFVPGARRYALPEGPSGGRAGLR